MLNRKASKASNGHAKSHRRSQRAVPAKARPVRRRFVISSAKSAHPAKAHDVRNGNGHSKSPTPPKGSAQIKGAVHPKNTHPKGAHPKGAVPAKTPINEQNATFTSQASSIDLTETIKTLLHLQQENGYVTYDDINDILPDGLNPDDLDELYTKLRTLDVEIVDQAEVERANTQEQEEDEDARLEILDDPVRMYMNQMGKVPLLTREQEVEICKRIEDAELEMKRIVYSLGFAAKEHIAIAEKLLSEPPKERFDRVVIDKKIANREGHLRDLRRLIKMVRTRDQKVDLKYIAWQKGRKQQL